MPVWKLEPLGAGHQYWGASSYQGPVIIRAPDEERARCIATLEFSNPTVEGEDTLLSPWDNSTLVGVSQITTTDYSEDGDDAILDPPDHDDEWRR